MERFAFELVEQVLAFDWRTLAAERVRFDKSFGRFQLKSALVLAQFVALETGQLAVSCLPVVPERFDLIQNIEKKTLRLVKKMIP